MNFLTKRKWGEQSTDGADLFLEQSVSVKSGTGIALGASGARHPLKGAVIRVRLEREEPNERREK